MMVAGSFHATRTTGTVSVCEIACSMGPTSFISAVPCCRSTHRASKPWRAMTSAVRPWDTESQPSVTHLPACHICLILFGRIVTPLALFIDPTNGSHAINRKRVPGSTEARTDPAIHKWSRTQQSCHYWPASRKWAKPRQTTKEARLDGVPPIQPFMDVAGCFAATMEPASLGSDHPIGFDPALGKQNSVQRGRGIKDALGPFRTLGHARDGGLKGRKQHAGNRARPGSEGKQTTAREAASPGRFTCLPPVCCLAWCRQWRAPISWCRRMMVT